MSRETEKVFKELHKYMKAHADENMSEEDLDDLMQTFMKQYNENLQYGDNFIAETADDYLEMAEDATSRGEALKYARKALELEPDNLDARRLVVELTTDHPYEMIEEYQKLVVSGKEIMLKKGYMDEYAIGDYWGILETRPFMRLCANYMETLIECGMMRAAASVGEELIRYNTNDNLGIRYTLMHIYAYLEDENCMLNLYEKYNEHEETQMLMPLSILYYKLGKLDQAEKYLKSLVRINKDTGRFIRAVLNDSLEKYIDRMNDMGYRPYSIEEFIVELNEYTFLFENAMGYFDWASYIIKRK